MNISGQYDGEMTAPTNGLGFLDLRIDVDKRYANSPVMKRVSGDFYQVNKINVPGSPPKVTRVYRESWIVNEPKVKKLNGKIEITGKVTFWKGIHPASTLKIRMAAPQDGVTPTCIATFTRAGGQSAVYNCTKKSDAFRTLNLEIDVCKSVNADPLLPSWDTSAHPIKPAALPQRVLTIEEAYREAGVVVNIRQAHSIVDDRIRILKRGLTRNYTTRWRPTSARLAVHGPGGRCGGCWLEHTKTTPSAGSCLILPRHSMGQVSLPNDRASLSFANTSGSTI